jgi:hypothetical protein
MVNLNFQGPFSFDDIDQNTGKIEKEGYVWDLKQAGIYIWGFEINQNFLPYYVGIASGGETNPMYISARIRTHYEGFYNLGKNPSTYMKPKLNYILGNGIGPLHTDPKFPRNFFGGKFGIQLNKKLSYKEILARFDFINNFKALYSSNPLIISYKQTQLPFHFIYTPIPQPLLVRTNDDSKKNITQMCIKCFLEHLETFTKYAIIGNTINKSGSIQKHCYSNAPDIYEGINFCCDQIEVEINVPSTIAHLFNNVNGKIVAKP